MYFSSSHTVFWELMNEILGEIREHSGTTLCRLMLHAAHSQHNDWNVTSRVVSIVFVTQRRPKRLSDTAIKYVIYTYIYKVERVTAQAFPLDYGILRSQVKIKDVINRMQTKLAESLKYGF
jgi:hypothetical protein